ncbi:MAG: response regulator transcription factor [Cyanobacteria bacterium]|nr:response regulator transcription factor [Cyanobacteriota bacterium]
MTSPASSNPSPSRIKIVYVEDYQLVRVGIAAYLNSLSDIEVVAQADSAEAGLIHVDYFKPDIVLMDLGLPKMNGIEATRLIKNKHPDIKVIILTSHQTEESVIAALGAGANAYCLKDITTERLVEVIHSVMDGAAWLDPTIAQIALSIYADQNITSRYGNNKENFSLGEREHEVLRLLTLGNNNNEIAAQLFVSVHTVKSQVSTILQKLSVHDRVQAAVKAVTCGLVSLEPQ